MPSLLPGFEYDIFISYRQKDNKYDGWVTLFVENLKRELEATFKENISVYFDINPHDGLLETHVVADSLKEKLRCLVFMPVISRTYCDPNSFAWKHEFNAFVESASKDQYGLKLKLANGNIVSRILPVIIHDLETDDLRLCESWLGYVLRGIDFIYKQPGVNRPLNPDDDENKNFYKTRYRNQVNKVANAIREIMASLKHNPKEPNPIDKESMIFTGNDKSIIVLPFDNLSPDPGQEYFSDGLTEEIITDLSYIHDLLVISRSSSMTFRGSKKTVPEIAREVNVRYVLEGSVRKSGNNLRITAQLIDAVNDSHVWAEKFTGTLDDIFDIQEKVSRSISEALKLKINGAEKDKLSEVTISDIVSYEFYIQAKRYMWSFTEEGLDHALKLTNQALSISGDNALLYATRSLIYWQYQNTGVRPSPDVLQKADKDAGRALQLDLTCAAAYRAKASVAYTKGELEIAVMQYRKAADLESGGESLSWLGYLHALAGQMDIAREYADRAVKVDPLNALVLCFRGIIEIYGGNFDTALLFLQRATEISPDNLMSYFYLAIVAYYAGKISDSENCFKLLARNEPGIPHSIANMWLAVINRSDGEFSEFSDRVKDFASHDKEVSWYMADCFSLTGNVDKALFWIENSIQEGLINHVFFSEVNPNLNQLRNDPRFIVLMEKAKARELNFSIKMKNQ